MSNLFGDLPAAPKPKTDPRVHICRACQKPGASCGIGEAFYCPACVPSNFWPHKRGGQA